MERVLITGAGTAGLILAHRLKEAGIEFKLFERDTKEKYERFEKNKSILFIRKEAAFKLPKSVLIKHGNWSWITPAENPKETILPTFTLNEYAQHKNISFKTDLFGNIVDGEIVLDALQSEVRGVAGCIIRANDLQQALYELTRDEIEFAADLSVAQRARDNGFKTVVACEGAGFYGRHSDWNSAHSLCKRPMRYTAKPETW